ncbi:MAG: hypothetical protein WA211_00045 [Candidatus Acidiferrales bacterium]
MWKTFRRTVGLRTAAHLPSVRRGIAEATGPVGSPGQPFTPDPRRLLGANQ